MTQIDTKLMKLAFLAVRKPDQWQRVLEHIISVTPAKAAIITLRDKTTCQIVNDDVLENEYHSPLVQGFPVEAVVYYLNELRTIDPWAKVQMVHYPFHPTIMSTICHPKTVKDRRFFDWLESCGLRDTVAFEIDRVPGHWTAMNLFLEHYDTDDGKALLEYCEAHQDIMREAWRSSQHVIKCQQSGYASLNHLTARAIPACIITPTGEVFLANEYFHRLQDQNIIRVSMPSGRLSVCDNARFFGVRDKDLLPVISHSNEAAQVNISVSAFDPDPLYGQKKECYWLLRFNETGSSFHAVADSAFPLEILTPQERQLFEAIRKGQNVRDAGKSIGLQRSRAFEVWAGVKTKLGITNAHELRGVLAAGP